MSKTTSIRIGQVVPGSRKCLYFRESDQRVTFGSGAKPQTVTEFVMSFPKGTRRAVRKALATMGNRDLAAMSVPAKNN